MLRDLTQVVRTYLLIGEFRVEAEEAAVLTGATAFAVEAEET